MSHFAVDKYPGQPRILFIGLPQSSHTHSWIRLLDDAPINCRLFGVVNTINDWPGILKSMPPDWHVPTYISSPIKFPVRLNPDIYFPVRNRFWLPLRIKNKLSSKYVNFSHELLSQVLKDWQPDIIHTLGIDPAGFIFSDFIEKHGKLFQGKWVAQIRGGSDLTLARFDPVLRPKIEQVVHQADWIVSDNKHNFEYLADLNVSSSKFAPIAPVPGTGGIHLDKFKHKSDMPPTSKRRVILYPKAYNCEWSLSLPVLEALKLCWERIQPVELHLLAIDKATEMWFMALPEEIKQHCHVHKRLPHEKVLALLSQARIMLAPSLVDGIPNVLYESMAAGALPIVSPLDTIKSLVRDEEHVLFARNLYPDEIADALVRAMNNDQLVDTITQNNLMFVEAVANRSNIRDKVIKFYQEQVN